MTVDLLRREIQRARRRFDLLDHIPVGICVVRNDFTVLYWNDCLEEWTGVVRSDIVGHCLFDKYPHLDSPRYAGRLATVFEGGPPAIFSSQLHRHLLPAQYPGNGLRIQHTVVTPVRALSGSDWYALFAIQDVTELHRRVQDYRHMRDQALEELIARKRIEQELEQARRSAEAATQAKSAFLARMSHEIRTPLNAILGTSDLLMDTELSSDQHEYAQTLRNSGGSLLTVINDILDFSKIEAGMLELENRPFDLRECVHDAVVMFSLESANKGIELAYGVGPGVPDMIVGDVTRLRQVLVNLLSNAIKFTSAGEVVVSVCAQPLTPDRCEIQFTVRDTGIGIDPEHRTRLFRPFSQEDASTTRRYGGTGLGLSICHQLVEMMGGTTHVESEVGRGSVFSFSIVAEVVAASSRPVHLSGEPTLLRGKRVLVVDDNATWRSLLTGLLEGWGMVVRGAESVSHALSFVTSGERFEAAILDATLPDAEPSAAIAELSRFHQTPALPIILVRTAGTSGRSLVVDDGAFAACLFKPVDPAGLFATLMAVFGGQSVVSATTAVRVGGVAVQTDGYPLRVLLVEDNVINQKVALRMLARLGCCADSASDGGQAVAAVQRRAYDVVLMDIEMPDMDGMEATRRIRSVLPGEHQPRIIALTAHATSAHRAQFLAAGMDDYLAKPIGLRELAAVLQREAENRSGSQPTAPRGVAGFAPETNLL